MTHSRQRTETRHKMLKHASIRVSKWYWFVVEEISDILTTMAAPAANVVVDISGAFCRFPHLMCGWNFFSLI